jgi:hypothetical protein
MATNDTASTATAAASASTAETERKRKRKRKRLGYDDTVTADYVADYNRQFKHLTVLKEERGVPEQKIWFRSSSDMQLKMILGNPEEPLGSIIESAIDEVSCSSSFLRRFVIVCFIAFSIKKYKCLFHSYTLARSLTLAHLLFSTQT